jgi:hypothetical protein
MTNLTLDEAKIRETAYLMWLDEGQPDGRDEEHWLKAIDALSAPQPKKQVRKKAVAKKAVTATPKAANTTKKPKAAAKRAKADA